jgi:hypothetical protein
LKIEIGYKGYRWINLGASRGANLQHVDGREKISNGVTKKGNF